MQKRIKIILKTCTLATDIPTYHSSRSLVKDIKNGLPIHNSSDLISSCPRCLAAVAKANKPNGLTDGESLITDFVGF